MFVDDVAVTSSLACNTGMTTLETIDDLPLEAEVLGAVAKPDAPAGGTWLER